MSGTPATPHTEGLNGMTMVSYSGPGALLADLALAPEFVDFLTIPAYALID
jgi:hypothetical protein